MPDNKLAHCSSKESGAHAVCSQSARLDVYCTHKLFPLQESLTSLLLSELAYKQANEVAAAATELQAGLPEGLITFERIQWSQDHVEHRSGFRQCCLRTCRARAQKHAT